MFFQLTYVTRKPIYSGFPTRSTEDDLRPGIPNVGSRGFILRMSGMERKQRRSSAARAADLRLFVTYAANRFSHHAAHLYVS